MATVLAEWRAERRLRAASTRRDVQPPPLEVTGSAYGTKILCVQRIRRHKASHPGKGKKNDGLTMGGDEPPGRLATVAARRPTYNDATMGTAVEPTTRVDA